MKALYSEQRGDRWTVCWYNIQSYSRASITSRTSLNYKDQNKAKISNIDIRDYHDTPWYHERIPRKSAPDSLQCSLW